MSRKWTISILESVDLKKSLAVVKVGYGQKMGMLGLE
jgi:hypothetical protein